MRFGRRRTLVVGIATFGMLAGVLVTAEPSGAAATVTPLITGLNAPRGVAFDGQGSLYVSESGKGRSWAVWADAHRQGQQVRVGARRPRPGRRRRIPLRDRGSDPAAGPPRPGGHQRRRQRLYEAQPRPAQRLPVLMIMSESHDGVAAESNGALGPRASSVTCTGSTARAARSPTSRTSVTSSTSGPPTTKALFPDDFRTPTRTACS